jgi:hypothetical protein
MALRVDAVLVNNIRKELPKTVIDSKHQVFRVSHSPIPPNLRRMDVTQILQMKETCQRDLKERLSDPREQMSKN